MTTSDYLTQLQQDREDLVDNLETKGITGLSGDETFTELVPEVLNIPSGGGSTGEFNVKVIDYDGTVLKEEYHDTGDIVTLPTAPSHTGLVFQEWSATVPISNNTVTVDDDDIMVGAIYTTASGLNEFDIELTPATGLEFTLKLDGTKNWGDGTSDTETTHTYSNYGEYTITCNGTNITSNYLSGLFAQGSSNYNWTVKSVRTATISNIKPNSFNYCGSLKNITLSNVVTTMDDNSFYVSKIENAIVPPRVTSMNLYVLGESPLKNIVIPYGVTTYARGVVSGSTPSLEKIIIPKTITTISSDAFYGANISFIKIPSSVTRIGNEALASNKFKNVVIPRTVTNINFSYLLYNNSQLETIEIPSNGNATTMANTFSSCFKLKEIVIPNGITTIGNSFANGCISLEKVVFPSTITSIQSNAFMNNRNNTIYDFRNLTDVPSLGNNTIFANLGNLSKMVVPDSLYEDWVVATNWVDYANYIVKASDYTE